LHSYDVHSNSVGLPYGCAGYLDRYVDDRSDFDGCKGGRCATNFLHWVNGGVRTNRHQLADWIDEAEMEIIEGLYDGCINLVDDQIALLVAHLNELGVYDRTVLVVTSDHGEQFGEHGSVGHGRNYEESVKIPLLLKLPGQAFAGRRVGTLATTIDVMPTLLEVLSRDAPEEMQGVSLMPAVRTDQAVRSWVLLDSALRTDRYKYIALPPRLYDLAADPGETDDLTSEHSELAEGLADAFREQRLRSDRQGDLLRAKQAGATAPRMLSEEERAHLEALGYVE
jgi:arylsulfatase A-like enzyme